MRLPWLLEVCFEVEGWWFIPRATLQTLSPAADFRRNIWGVKETFIESWFCDLSLQCSFSWTFHSLWAAAICHFDNHNCMFYMKSGHKEFNNLSYLISKNFKYIYLRIMGTWAILVFLRYLKKVKKKLYKIKEHCFKTSSNLSGQTWKQIAS